MRRLFVLSGAEGLLMASFDKGFAQDVMAERLSEGRDSGLEEHSTLPRELLSTLSLDELLRLEEDGAIFF